MARINLRNTECYLEDAAGYRLALGPGPGDLSVSNLVAFQNREKVEATNRTDHDGFVTGPRLRQEVTITLELNNAHWTQEAVANLLDFLRLTGIYAPITGSQQLVSVDECDWAYKLVVEHNVCDVSGGFTLPKLALVGAFAEGETASTLALSGTNYVQPAWA